MAKADLSAQLVRELLDYCPETGALTWRPRAGSPGNFNGKFAGKDAVHLESRGYVVLHMTAVGTYLAHRIAWLHAHGEWPAGQIDHINGIRHDNRLCNLRDVPPETNSENRTRANRNRSSRLPLGVYRGNGGKFVAQIRSRGEIRYLGRFSTPEEAHEAFLKAKRALHAGCTI